MQLVVAIILLEQQYNVVQASQFLDLWVSLANVGVDKHSRHGIQLYVCVRVCVCVCVWISNLISSESFILREKGTVTLWYDISSYSRKFYLLIIIRLLRRIRKASIFFVVLIRLSVRVEQLGLQWMHFHKISFLKVFRKSVEKKFKIYLNLTRITGALYEDQYTFLI